VIAADFLQFVQQYPATLDYLCFNDEAHFHLDGFMNKHNMKFWVYIKIHTDLWRHQSILQNAPYGVQSASKDLLDQSLWRAL